MDAVVLDFFRKYLICPVVTLLVAGVLLFFAHKANLLEKKVLVYLPISVLVVSLMGLLGVTDVYFMPYTFLVVQTLVLLLGLINYFLLTKWKAELTDSLGKFALLLLPQILMSYAFFSLFFNLANSFQYGAYAGMVVCSFSIAPLFMYAYHAYLQIPIEVYKLREFHSSDSFSRPCQALGTEGILVCEIELYRSQGDKEAIRIKAKAKSDMVVGDWFGWVVSDYNQQAGGRSVELNGEENHYGWIFYVKPSFFTLRRYIDPDATFIDNRLKEKDLIVAKRVKSEA